MLDDLIYQVNTAKPKGYRADQCPGDHYGMKYIPHLQEAMTRYGFRVANFHPVEMDGTETGYVDYRRKVVHINMGTSANLQVRVGAHELGHILTVPPVMVGDPKRMVPLLPHFEVIAEAISYLYCKRIGLDTRADAIAYIAGMPDPILKLSPADLLVRYQKKIIDAFSIIAPSV